MTDDDKRKIKGELLLEFQEAEENAALLRQKIKTLRSNLSGIEGWLMKVERATSHSELIKTEFWSSSHGEQINVLGNAKYRDAMDYEQVVELTKQVTAALLKLEELGKTKRELGLK